MLAPFTMLVANFGLAFYAVPAIFSLSKGIRPGLEELTLNQALRQLRDTGKSGWELVEGARDLVAERMQYSRRNSFDSDARAFERGYGLCTQQAYVLVDLLKRLGFESKAI
jgi:transglutaminase-like putative cysteine protease